MKWFSPEVDPPLHPSTEFQGVTTTESIVVLIAYGDTAVNNPCPGFLRYRHPVGGRQWMEKDDYAGAFEVSIFAWTFLPIPGNPGEDLVFPS